MVRRSKKVIKAMEMLLNAEYIFVGDYFVRRTNWRLVDNTYFDPQGNELTGGQVGLRVWSHLARVGPGRGDGTDT